MKKPLCLLLAVLLLAALFTGCEKKSDVTVSVQSVSLITGYGPLGRNNRYAGIVEAGSIVSVQKDEHLEIGELCVEVGDEVMKGQLLFTYDTEAIALDLEKAKLERDQLENTVTTKNASIASLEKEKAKAKSDEQIDYTLQIQELQLDVSEAKLNIAAKEKEIERLQQQTEDTEVRAECDGRVQSINDPKSENYDSSKPYLTLAQAGNYRIKGTVTEQYAASLYAGLPMLIRSRADESVVWHGVIDRVDTENPVQNNNNYYGPSSDELSTASKYPFYVTLENDDGLMLGQHVYIELETAEEKSGLYLNAAYINDVDRSAWVWAADSKDKLEKRNVQLGEYDQSNDSWEIVSGLSPSDYIAFPDETCEVGANVVRYDENSFEGGFGPEGGYEEGFEEGFEGDFGEGGFEEGFEGGYEEGDLGEGDLGEGGFEEAGGVG